MHVCIFIGANYGAIGLSRKIEGDLDLIIGLGDQSLTSIRARLYLRVVHLYLVRYHRRACLVYH